MRPTAKMDIYGGKKPGDIPVYSVSAAAHYLQLPLATVRSWTIGRKYNTQSGPTTFKPVISIEGTANRLLSFRNLVELHVLSSIIRTHKVRLQAIRQAIKFLKNKYSTEHPLLNHQMLTD